MTIIVRSIYNFVNCLQFNIRYEKVERSAPLGSALVVLYIWYFFSDFFLKGHNSMLNTGLSTSKNSKGHTILSLEASLVTAHG